MTGMMDDEMISDDGNATEQMMMGMMGQQMMSNICLAKPMKDTIL
jgi:hypothetical protein